MKSERNQTGVDHPGNPHLRTGLECCLDFAKTSFPGIPWHVPFGWADQLIVEHELVLTNGAGDMTGEAHAVFDYEGTKLRLGRTYQDRYELYHGEWQHDPHWAGD